MQLRLPRGRTGLVLGAVLAALLVPAAVSAAGSRPRAAHSGCSRAEPRRSAGTGGGQAPDIYLVQLAGSADTFRRRPRPSD